MHLTHIYIDGANLHQGSKSWGQVDYKKLYRWLQDKYRPKNIYIFIGYIAEQQGLYDSLQEIGYRTVFKETKKIGGKIKGNVDTELTIESMKNFYEQEALRTILITGDGDFACLVDFFRIKKHPVILIAPNKENLSYLLRKANIPLVFLEEQSHKIKKAPR